MARAVSPISAPVPGPVQDHVQEHVREHAPGHARAALVPSVSPLSLLVVGGHPDDRRGMETLLWEGGAEGSTADSVTHMADAVRAAKDARYDAVVLIAGAGAGNGGTPSASAVETINELLDDTPVLILSDEEDAEGAVGALRAGAQDYLVRDAIDGRALVRAVRFAIERKRTEQRLQALLNYDTLTHLPNRELLLDRLTQSIAQATRQQTLVALLLLDLDRFKLVNDTMGHAFGDKLLRAVAAKIGDCIRESDTVARLGGDEFVVVLSNIKGAQDAAKVASKILGDLSRPMVIEDHEVFVSASIGISLFPNDGLDKNSLITNADVAMYRAKEEGRNHFQFYTFGMNATTVERLTLENDLRRAVEREELVLHYQPQMDLRTGEISGFEALVRWQHPELGVVPPARFIPMAEENGMIVAVGEWVLREACRQTKAWLDAGARPAVVSVNLSSRQFHQESMLKTVTGTLDEMGLPADLLALEITESSLMNDPDDAVVTLCLLHNLGVSISIDDFGTGYSSLGHLKRFPLDALKVDRAFIQEITENPEDEAIVRAILAMAHSLGLRVVAEGVETEDQRAFLRDMGCDGIQGYVLAKPLPAPAFARQFLGLSGD